MRSRLKLDNLRLLVIKSAYFAEVTLTIFVHDGDE
jgi:hypothetical protein